MSAWASALADLPIMVAPLIMTVLVMVATAIGSPAIGPITSGTPAIGFTPVPAPTTAGAITVALPSISAVVADGTTGGITIKEW